MTPTVAAVIVNYNSGAELRTALQSIAQELPGPWEGVVIDNASSDGSEATALEFPQVRLLRNRDNVGFARGVNQAISASAAPRLLIMNPDCRLLPGALATMMAVLDAEPGCAIAAPRILNLDGSPQGNARGDPNMLTGLFGRTSALRRTLPWLNVARRNVLPDATSSPGTGIGVDWVSGACMLARRAQLAEAGGFDERYFMYWEDADLCRRLRARGYSIRYAPAATAVHRAGHSSRTVRAASIRAFNESAYLYYATHVATGAVNPKRLLARGLLSARCWWQLRER